MSSLPSQTDAAASSAPPQPPAKRARREATIEVPECLVCLELAVPPVVLDCDHTLCGPCTRELERPRPVRAAGFACPQCRRRVAAYTVPTVFRDAAYQAASDEQRAACDAFMREYRDAEPPPPARPDTGDPVVERMIAVLRAIPRQLTDPTWSHNGTQWSVRVRNAFAETSTFRSEHVRSVLRRLVTRLRRGGMGVRRDGTDAIVALQVVDIERFASMQWPDAPVGASPV